jgi:RsiW-degrading membrane proteinase PrsW (M82 family)
MAILLLITMRSRTVPLTQLFATFFVGYFIITTLARVVASPVKMVFPLDESNFVSDYFVPVTEELLKVVPAALYLFWSAWKKRGQPSASDALLLAYVSAAGFAIYESSVIGEAFGDGWTEVFPLSLVLPLIETADLGSAGSESVTFLSANHALWSSLVGLAIGVAFLLRGKRPWVWLIPLLAFGVSVGSHVLYNRSVTAVAADSSPFWLDLVDLAVLNGWLVVLLLLAGTAAVLVWELMILRAASENGARFTPLGPSGLLGALAPPITTARAMSARSAFRYTLLLRAQQFAAWRAKRLGPGPGDAALETSLARERARAGV